MYFGIYIFYNSEYYFTFVTMNQIELFVSPSKEVAQHNNLIFAPFALDSIESRIFISMLERIERSAESFPEWRIPVNEIIKHSGGSYYEELKKARFAIIRYAVDIAPANSNGKKYSKPRTIVLKCDHEEGKGYIICQFHEHMREYLLKLLGNFTRADLSVLKNFKDEKSVRFYWMLKSRFYNQDIVTISVEECRKCLLPEGSTAYIYPNDFKKHVLEKIIKPELNNTDCAFDLGEPIKSGNKTTAWTFKKRTGSVTPIAPTPITISDKLIEELKSCGIDEKGLRKINEVRNKIINGVLIDEDFIRYVANTRKQEKAQQKDIENLGGYIVDTITKGWLSSQYTSKKTRTKKPTPTPPPKQPNNGYTTITMQEAEKMYEVEKAAGTTKFALSGFIKGIKTGRFILVEGFQY